MVDGLNILFIIMFINKMSEFETKIHSEERAKQLFELALQIFETDFHPDLALHVKTDINDWVIGMFEQSGRKVFEDMRRRLMIFNWSESRWRDIFESNPEKFLQSMYEMGFDRQDGYGDHIPADTEIHSVLGLWNAYVQLTAEERAWVHRIIRILYHIDFTKDDGPEFMFRFLNLREYGLPKYIVNRIQDYILKNIIYLPQQLLNQLQSKFGSDIPQFVQYLTGGDEYKISSGFDQALEYLRRDIEFMHQRGKTARDFFNRVEPSVYEIYQNLGPQNTVPGTNITVQEFVTETFSGLIQRDLEQLLKYLDGLNSQGMTYQEFIQGNGPHWDLVDPELGNWIRQAYTRYYEQIVKIFEDRFFQELHTLPLDDVYIFTQLRQVVYSGIRQDLLYWFEHIQRRPGLEQRVNDVLKEARFRAIQFYLECVEFIAKANPYASLKDFYNRNFVLNQDELPLNQIQKFWSIASQIPTFPEYSDIQKEVIRIWKP